jgi:hypothetical protein
MRERLAPCIMIDKVADGGLKQLVSLTASPYPRGLGLVDKVRLAPI